MHDDLGVLRRIASPVIEGVEAFLHIRETVRARLVDNRFHVVGVLYKKYNAYVVADVMCQPILCPHKIG